MPVLPFLLMSETQAANFREETANDEHRLDPRRVDAGPYANKYVLPERVLYSENFVDRRDAFRLLTKINMDTDIAWPPVEEEEEVEE